MTGHFRAAEQLIERADYWLDDAPAGMPTRERVERRQADLLGAIAHALLGLADAFAPPARPSLTPAPSTRVPVLDIPMRTDMPREETPS